MASYTNGHSDSNSVSKIRKYDIQTWKTPLFNGRLNGLKSSLPTSVHRLPRNGVRRKVICSNPFVKPKEVEVEVKQNGSNSINVANQPDESAVQKGPLSQNLGCLYKEYGCSVVGDVDLLSKHLLSCEYEPMYRCVHSGCNFGPTSAALFVKHVVQAHGTPVYSLDDVDTDIPMRLAWKFPKNIAKLQWVAAVFLYKDSPLLLMMDILQPWVNMWIWDFENRFGHNSKIKIQLTLVSAVPEIRSDDSWCQDFLPFDPKKPFLNYEAGKSYQMKIVDLFMRYIRYDCVPPYFVLRLQLL